MINNNTYDLYRNVQDLLNGRPMYSYQKAHSETFTNSASLNTQGKMLIIAGTYKIGRKFGNGNFGDVNLGKNIHTNDFVAIKLEKLNHSSNSLSIENRVYQKLQYGDGIPKIFYHGQFMNQNVLVIELLSLNLEDLFNLCNRRFTLKTICMIAIQLFKRIEYIHSNNLIYRDIKPENFLIGRQEVNKHKKIYLVDFGLAKEFINSGGSHIPYSENNTLVGTARYMSLNTHLGREQSRRDDIESIGYLLIYFLKGNLPWQGLHAYSLQERYTKIGETKKNSKIEDLCLGCPKEFENLLRHARNLEFMERPNYEMLVKSFENLIYNNYWSIDWEFDWIDKLQSSKNTFYLNETV
ncbi:unnamed protein product [Brachionus calyciflorus]|uniref:non-specific serine/threonine protein kinase n=1 Tax=Brachionus calyciflorus TaxID=104777 RepID=A0A813Q777_9BILA|nr:unnamed protein product [Brachionus calyciflorus]